MSSTTASTTAKTSKVSLQAKLVGMTAGVWRLLGGASFGVMSQVINEVERGIDQNFYSNADFLADSVSNVFFERYGDVQAFAISPAIQSPRRQEIVQALNHFANLYGIYDLIMVVDAGGRLVAVNDRSPGGDAIASERLDRQNYADAAWFKAVMKGDFTEDKGKGYAGTFVEDVQEDPYSSAVYGGRRLGSEF